VEAGDEDHGSGELHRGACVCRDHELRITERCLTEDLGFDRDLSFEDSLVHPIVAAFRKERSRHPGRGNTVGPAAGDRTLFTLRRGNDHRGATIFDAEQRVVWLAAYGYHRSGQADDAFKQFASLLQTGEIFPTAADYRRLGQERGRRFGETLPVHAERLTALALDQGGQIVSSTLGFELPVRIVAVIDRDLLELQVAFQAQDFDRERVNLALAALTGDDDPAWEVVGDLRGLPLEREIAFRLYRSIPSSRGS
jgi:hypothetical protein